MSSFSRVGRSASRGSDSQRMFSTLDPSLVEDPRLTGISFDMFGQEKGGQVMFRATSNKCSHTLPDLYRCVQKWMSVAELPCRRVLGLVRISDDDHCPYSRLCQQKACRILVEDEDEGVAIFPLCYHCLRARGGKKRSQNQLRVQSGEICLDCRPMDLAEAGASQCKEGLQSPERRGTSGELRRAPRRLYSASSPEEGYTSAGDSPTSMEGSVDGGSPPRRRPRHAPPASGSISISPDLKAGQTPSEPASPLWSAACPFPASLVSLSVPSSLPGGEEYPPPGMGSTFAFPIPSTVPDLDFDMSSGLDRWISVTPHFPLFDDLDPEAM